MSKLVKNSGITPVLAAILGLAFALGAGAVAFAGTDDAEDLSDNETCLDCHRDQEHLGLLEVEGPNVHDPNDGSVKGEAHSEFACIDCHMDIEQIPHEEDVERTVDCLACHAEVPK